MHDYDEPVYLISIVAKVLAALAAAVSAADLAARRA